MHYICKLVMASPRPAGLDRFFIAGRDKTPVLRDLFQNGVVDRLWGSVGTDFVYHAMSSSPD